MRTSPDRTIDISVVVICYNQERTVAAALDSVLTQTARDRIGEIFVVDDCSTDGTLAVARAMAARHPGITVIAREANSGGCAAPRNDGILRAAGTHVALLDGDDTWHPDKIATLIAALEACPGIGLLYSDFVTFDALTGQETRGHGQSPRGHGCRPAAPLLHPWRAGPAVLRGAEPGRDRGGGAVRCDHALQRGFRVLAARRRRGSDPSPAASAPAQADVVRQPGVREIRAGKPRLQGGDHAPDGPHRAGAGRCCPRRARRGSPTRRRCISSPPATGRLRGGSCAGVWGSTRRWARRGLRWRCPTWPPIPTRRCIARAGCGPGAPLALR